MIWNDGLFASRRFESWAYKREGETFPWSAVVLLLRGPDGLASVEISDDEETMLDALRPQHMPCVQAKDGPPSVALGARSRTGAAQGRPEARAIGGDDSEDL